MRKLIAALAIFAVANGCTRVPRASMLAESSAQRVERGQLKNVEIKVRRSDLVKALELGAPTNNVRLVPVFRGTGGSNSSIEPPPEYRFFDVNQRSAYSLLGFRTNDVLVSVEDHVLYKPQNFPEYVRQLPNVQRGWVEIRRGNEAILLTFVMQ